MTLHISWEEKAVLITSHYIVTEIAFGLTDSDVYLHYTWNISVMNTENLKRILRITLHRKVCSYTSSSSGS